MCTVTYIPIDNKDFIFTSNRDENPNRKAIAPMTYVENGVKMVYPKDELAGGTWIGISEKKRLVCLLNGGFEKHKHNAFYKMSRGVIVRKLLKAKNLLSTIYEFNFENIEPFTIVLIDWNTKLSVYELVWDGIKKHVKELKNEPKIWSSSTLYDAQMKQDRANWFNDWLEEGDLNQEEVMRFHQDTERGTQETALKMKRPFVETVSITSVKKEKEHVTLHYLDFVHDKKTSAMLSTI
ncbi:MAG: hypothetical protein GKR88_16380 [Flavobacteriaceae bacterium]|nr:MAG: hypothetical protein GKR88_16380 [Flavobacteriaceae bacterium]